ncbi:uncharacterized protein LOC116298485 [Actinia tenebrosa]|uniref:Uncharacterized protein LOC116298485 n=1 Tax=Actinia tenebrosa TaxID=6105 RepID=A0A6P8I2R7_ACTTE|nr:uncharacterized protein LOC116298485 [Actinia tenebrosa]
MSDILRLMAAGSCLIMLGEWLDFSLMVFVVWFSVRVTTDDDNTDMLLLHLKSQQPTIRCTIETESENKIAFMDNMVHREPNGRLCTSADYKPVMHTDQYLVYDSHHPQSVKHVVNYLYDRGHRIVTKPNTKRVIKSRPPIKTA